MKITALCLIIAPDPKGKTVTLYPEPVEGGKVLGPSTLDVRDTEAQQLVDDGWAVPAGGDKLDKLEANRKRLERRRADSAPPKPRSKTTKPAKKTAPKKKAVKTTKKDPSQKPPSSAPRSKAAILGEELNGGAANPDGVPSTFLSEGERLGHADED